MKKQLGSWVALALGCFLIYQCNESGHHVSPPVPSAVGQPSYIPAPSSGNLETAKTLQPSMGKFLSPMRPRPSWCVLEASWCMF